MTALAGLVIGAGLAAQQAPALLRPRFPTVLSRLPRRRVKLKRVAGNAHRLPALVPPE